MMYLVNLKVPTEALHKCYKLPDELDVMVILLLVCEYSCLSSFPAALGTFAFSRKCP